MASICAIMTDKKIDESIVYNRISNKNNTILFSVKKTFSFNNKDVYFEKNSRHNEKISEYEDCEILLYGCLYNADAVKDQLVSLGREVKTNHQEEVIVSAYKEWSNDFIEKFNGAFCFILFDKIKNEIIFGRDRLGKKNLYYYFNDGDLLISTELKAFFNCDFIEKEMNTDVMGSYMRLGFVPCPYSILKNVYKVMPGSIVTVKDGGLSSNNYWSPLKAYKENHQNQITDFNDAKSQLEELLKICVKDRLENDKSFGVFLSSGIDSSLMTAIAQNISEEKIDSFTIGVDNKKYNEAVIAKQIATHIGTNHNEHYISEKDLLNVIENIPEYYDEPFGDSSMVPSMLLTDYVKDKVDIAIGGDGGDEIFCGYPHYKVLPIAQKLDFVGAVLNKILPSSIKRKLPHSAKRVLQNRNKNTKCQMVMSEELEKYNKLLKHSFHKPCYEIEEQMGVSNWQIRRMILDMQTTLPDEMNYKVEKAALSSELDVRAPILDYRVVEFSFRLPQKFKYDGKTTKLLLRSLAADYIPEEILNSPKRGFSVPIADWMRSSLAEMLLRYCDETMLEKQDIFNYIEIKNMIEQMLNGDDKIASTCWNYLMFQLWYDKYMGA